MPTPVSTRASCPPLPLLLRAGCHWAVCAGRNEEMAHPLEALAWPWPPQRSNDAGAAACRRRCHILLLPAATPAVQPHDGSSESSRPLVSGGRAVNLMPVCLLTSLFSMKTRHGAAPTSHGGQLDNRSLGLTAISLWLCPVPAPRP